MNGIKLMFGIHTVAIAWLVTEQMATTYEFNMYKQRMDGFFPKIDIKRIEQRVDELARIVRH